MKRYGLSMWRTTFLAAVCLSVMVGLGGEPVQSFNEYVRVTRQKVNIRSAPTTRSKIVAPARRGNVFEVRSEDDKWYEIQLFSGGRRFIHKSLVEKASYRPEVPDDVELRRQIFRQWKEAGLRAEKEANRKYPREKDLERNLEEIQLLGDRYRLELLHELQVEAPVYRRILIEGYQKGW